MSDVVVHVPDEKIVIETDSGPGSLVVVETGAQGFLLVGVGGLQGPPGPPGVVPQTRPKTWTHTQSEPATRWHVIHGLGFDPDDILVIDDRGDIAEGWGVTFTEPGMALTLDFQIPCAGTARFS